MSMKRNPTKERYVRFRSVDWFKENAWEDFDGDYWPTEEDYKLWDKDSSDEDYILSKWIMWQDAGKIVSYKEYEKINPAWGIEEEITKEEYPEYYL